jgi:hypothetical protein
MTESQPQKAAPSNAPLIILCVLIVGLLLCNLLLVGVVIADHVSLRPLDLPNALETRLHVVERQEQDLDGRLRLTEDRVRQLENRLNRTGKLGQLGSEDTGQSP